MTARFSLALLAALTAAMLLSLFAGKVWLPLSAFTPSDPRWLIIAELRLPRTLLAAIVGAGLGISGAAMQGYLRNPLADPGLFGVSAAAALGAVVSMFFGVGAPPWLLPAFALAGAGAAMALLALLVGRSGSMIVFTLGGVIIASLAGAMTALAISLAPTPFATAQIVTWLMGALIDRSWADVWLALPLVALGIALLGLTGRDLDALTLGEAAAQSMGVDPARLQALVVVGVGLCVGASVATAGIIGFVGLIVPHLVRSFAGHRPSAVLLPSGLAGALLLVAADSVVRVAPTVSELRLGIAMSLLGAPFFLALLLRMRRQLP
ncbi:MAG: FecCD family ABC transporter permease [Polymorphobacter sp.]